MMLLTNGLSVNNTPVCNFAGHQSLIIGETLYVDGGVYTPRGKTPEDLDYRDLQMYDLSSVSTQTIGGKKFKIPKRTSISRPTSVINTRLGYLFTDKAQRFIFRYGGNWVDPAEIRNNLSDQQSKTALVGFDTKAKNLQDPSAWNVQQNTTPPTIGRLCYGAGTRVTDQGKGFYIGGFDDIYGNNHDSSQTEQASASHDIITWEQPLDWTNETVYQDNSRTAVYSPGAGGLLTYLPIGEEGTLVSFGGRQWEGFEAQRLQMSDIRMYDVKSNTWFTQTAKGEIPSPRNNFCGVTAVAKDNSSYNIYITGGQTGPNTGADDVYILSIPSFRWFSAYSGSNVARLYQSCELMKNQQMAVIGGYNATALSTPQCAEQMGGDLRFFDMNELKWNDYDPSKNNYQVPDLVTAAIGGDGNGGAKARSPFAGWTDPSLRTLFGQAAPKDASSDQSAGGDNSTGSSNSTTAQSGSHVSPGAIAGGAIGGTAALVLIIALIFLIYKKCFHRQTKIALLLENSEKPLPSPPEAPSSYGMSSGSPNAPQKPYFPGGPKRPDVSVQPRMSPNSQHHAHPPPQYQQGTNPFPMAGGSKSSQTQSRSPVSPIDSASSRTSKRSRTPQSWTGQPPGSGGGGGQPRSSPTQGAHYTHRYVPQNGVANGGGAPRHHRSTNHDNAPESINSLHSPTTQHAPIPVDSEYSPMPSIHELPATRSSRGSDIISPAQDSQNGSAGLSSAWYGGSGSGGSGGSRGSEGFKSREKQEPTELPEFVTTAF